MSSSSLPFVNTLPYISPLRQSSSEASHPIEEFGDFRFVNWEHGIYPKFKGESKKEEIKFFTDLITSRGLKSVIDFGVGGGTELGGIVQQCKEDGYKLDAVEANEVDDVFIAQAQMLFEGRNQNISIHKANWLDLPAATPQFIHQFDFGFLTGNSLTYIGGGTREYTKNAQQSIVGKFAQLIRKGGYLFIDSRNYDYIKSLMNLPKEQIFEHFTFDYTVYYHGAQTRILVFPAYISDTVVVLHYYDKESRVWSKLDLYPIYQEDMLDMLSKDFVVEKVYHDFQEDKKARSLSPSEANGTGKKSLFVQYSARRK